MMDVVHFFFFSSPLPAAADPRVRDAQQPSGQAPRQKERAQQLPAQATGTLAHQLIVAVK